MSRLRLVFVGALVALVLPLTAGTASAQSGEITITGAEVVTDFGKPSGSDVNVIGTVRKGADLAHVNGAAVAHPIALDDPLPPTT